MSMVGSPKHVKNCVAAGVDIICAQGTEAGGHTGEISTLVLLPQVIDMCEGKALVVAAGGIYDGRGIAACLTMGAAGVWVGTAFLATPEANVEDTYKQKLLESESAETIRSETYTGRYEILTEIQGNLTDICDILAYLTDIFDRASAPPCGWNSWTCTAR